MYQFWLGNILFPVTPSSIKLSIKNQNKTVSIANGGEVNLVKSPGLTDISFTAILPARTDYPFAIYPLHEEKAAYYLQQLESMKTSLQPVQFHIVRVTDDGTEAHSTHLKVTLESYDILEDAEKYGLDTAVSVKLKQYAACGTKIITVNSETAEATEEKTRDDSTAPVKSGSVYSYTVQPGDTLRTIAARIYDDESLWKEIYARNETVIESTAKERGYASSINGALLFTGTKLNIVYEV